MCISSLLSIKVTSPITHMVSSAVRGVAGSLLGVWVFGDIFTRCCYSLAYISLLFLTKYTAVAQHPSQQSSSALSCTPGSSTKNKKKKKSIPGSRTLLHHRNRMVMNIKRSNRTSMATISRWEPGRKVDDMIHAINLYVSF